MADMTDNIIVLLTNRAPRSLNPQEWEIVVQTPEENAAAQHLVVRQRGTKAIIYGHKGAGMDIRGAGLYAGVTVDICDGNYDDVAAAIFEIGEELHLDRKMLWTLIQDLPSGAL